MDIGDYDDVQMLVAQAGEGYLRKVLGKAEFDHLFVSSMASGFTG